MIPPPIVIPLPVGSTLELLLNKPPGLSCAFKLVAGNSMAASPSESTMAFKELNFFIELIFRDFKISRFQDFRPASRHCEASFRENGRSNPVNRFFEGAKIFQSLIVKPILARQFVYTYSAICKLSAKNSAICGFIRQNVDIFMVQGGL
jgi:hypothetical protein